MKQRDALEIFSFTNYYGAHTTTVLLNASNSVKYAVKTSDIVEQHKRVETLQKRDSIDDLATAQGRLVHLRDNEVVLFKVPRSNYWQARFRIYTGKWIRFSTRRRNLDDARQIACDRYDEARYRERLGFTALVKRFDEMAKCCIAEMRRDIAAGTGKKIYTAYIAVIETYLIPFFGQMYLTSITNKHIAEFEVWRNSQLRRPPKVSTLLTFSTAFTRITQTAVEQGWISDKVPVPKLNVRGEKGQARPAFTNDEVVRIQQHLLTWYVGVEGYTGEMRLMLRDLVDILTLTGMRQGTESMNLEWRHIEWYVEKDVRYLRIWVSGKTGARWLIAKHECLSVLKRLKATHNDTADLSFDDLLALRMPVKLFRFQDGRKPFEMNKIFRRLLEEVDLVQGQAGTDRTLYSLRHTYATQELLAGTDIHTLARQMGTSVTMLEKHYSKLTATMAAEQLA
jgi:integrase